MKLRGKRTIHGINELKWVLWKNKQNRKAFGQPNQEREMNKINAIKNEKRWKHQQIRFLTTTSQSMCQ